MYLIENLIWLIWGYYGINININLISPTNQEKNIRGTKLGWKCSFYPVFPRVYLYILVDLSISVAVFSFNVSVVKEKN